MNITRAAVCCVSTLFLMSCAQLPPPQVSKIGAMEAERARSGPPPGGQLPTDPIEIFAQQVATQRLAGPMESVVANWRVRGLYAGRIGDCDSVTVENVTLRNTQHYRVCAGQVMPFTGVAPSFPSDNDAQRVRTSVSRAAYLNGTAAQQWGAYAIQARTVGPLRADRCASVQTTVTYQGMLVDQQIELICN